MGQGHAHGHAHGTGGDARAAVRARQTRVLWWALGINGVLLVAEVVAGFVFGSLALLADAAHMLSDVAGLGIALIAQALMARPHTPRHTFGLQRAEALGAQANGVLLLASVIWIGAEAVQRIGAPVEIDGGPVLVVATLGLLVNVVSAVALARVRGESLNVRGAYLHMVADALGSVGAIIAALAVVLVGAVWVDTVASVLIAAMVLWSAWVLLRDTTNVLMEATPPGIDAGQVAAALVRHEAVEDVHHLHLWSIASDTVALSAHVVLAGELGLHEAQQRGDDLRAMLRDEFRIEHATLELECHLCEEGAPVTDVTLTSPRT